MLHHQQSFYMGGGGGGGETVTIPNVSDSDFSVTAADAGFIFDVDGDAVRVSDGPTTDWVSPSHPTVGNGYWIKVHVTAGAFQVSAGLDSWLQLSSSRQWRCTRSTPGISSATCDIEIATDSGGVNVVATRNGVTVSAEVD